MARRYRCDVPGCTRPRERWQRLCTSCWAALPADIRKAIADNHRFHNRPAHRAACLRAASHLAIAREQATRRQQAAFERTARLLGEH